MVAAAVPAAWRWRTTNRLRLAKEEGARALKIRTTRSHENGNAGFIRDLFPANAPETFDQARADFEAASKVFLSNRTDADFQVWRVQEAWTAEKYRRFDRDERMSPDWRPSAA
jgi:hypothetical protein